jgi:hypothetical protein
MERAMTLDAAFLERLQSALARGAKSGALGGAQLAPGAENLAGASILTLTALGASMMRFARPVAPAQFEPAKPAPDNLPSAETRALLNRLALDELGVGAMAVADALARKRLAFHPFDRPRYPQFMRVYGPLLGVSAPVGDEDARADDFFAAEMIGEENWTQYSPAAQAAFIRAQRMANTDQARALVEASFAQLPAASRLRILEALETGLSAADQPFLEALAKDRAPKVRGAAENLLSRLPGTEAFAKRIAMAQEALKLEAKRDNLKIKIISAYAANSYEEGNWLSRSFAGLPLQPLAEALGCDIATLLRAAKPQSVLLMLFVEQALVEGRVDTLAAARQDGDLWVTALHAIGARAQAWPVADRRAIVKALFRPHLFKGLLKADELGMLYAFLRAPLEQELALLAFDRCVDDFSVSAEGALIQKRAAILTAFVALSPSTAHGHVVSRLSALPFEEADAALRLARVLQSIESTGSVHVGVS